MKRFAPEADRYRHTKWPEPDKKDGALLFSPRARFRHLVVMVDRELLDEGPAQPLFFSRSSALSELLRSPLVHLYRYADEGPVDVKPNPKTVGWMSETYEGWVVAEPAGDWAWLASYGTADGHWSQSGIAGDAVRIAADDDTVDAYRDRDPDEARRLRLADGLASQVALQGLAADIYVTDRAFLHAVPWNLTRGVAICTPDEALPLVGLYLRAQGDFRFADRATMNRGLFYWVGTREALSSGWRWTSALGQHGRPTQDSSLLLLGMSVLQRFERTLEARDALHVALNQPQHNDTRREALSRLDDVLVDLMGAMDAAARVVHRVLQLRADKEYTAGWQKAAWRKEVRASAPALADLVEDGTEGQAVLSVLRLLRNSVHGTALQAIALQERMRPQASLVRIPSEATSELLDAMTLLGGEWGIRQVVSDQHHVDPGIFVERLFPHVVSLLNDLMDQTPVERLDNVTLTDDDTKPPARRDPRNSDLWDEWVRLSIRWQLGL